MAATPLLLSARRAAKLPTLERGVFDLSKLADSALADPKKAGLALNANETQMAWPEHPELGPIHVKRSKAAAPDRAWISFEWRGIVVSRYVPIAKEAAK